MTYNLETASADGCLAANDNVRFRGGYPALNSLAKEDEKAARAALIEIGNSRHQTHADAAPGYLNPAGAGSDDTETHFVPDEPLTSETLSEPTQGGQDEVWSEVLHEIRPSEREICRALDWIEWPLTGRSDPIGWSMRKDTGRLVLADGSELRPVYGRTRAQLTGMTFATGKGAGKQPGGLMVGYRDAKGLEQRPVYTATKPRGGKRPHRTKAAIADYLDMAAAIASPLRAEGYQTPISSAQALTPMYTPQLRKAPDAFDRHGRYGVAEGRAELEALMEKQRPPITVCPTTEASRLVADNAEERLAHFRATGVILPRKQTLAPTARGARFIAGISGAKQTASVPAPNWQVPEAKPLSPALEEAAARGDLADIGRALGDKTTRPDRLGKRVLLAEARALMAANDNALKKVAA